MPGTNTSRRSLRCRGRGQRSHLQPHTTRRPARLAYSGQLMGLGCGLVLPRVGPVPVVHRLVADDHLAVMLAKSLVELDIAVPRDSSGKSPPATARFSFGRPNFGIKRYGKK